MRRPIPFFILAVAVAAAAALTPSSPFLERASKPSSST